MKDTDYKTQDQALLSELAWSSDLEQKQAADVLRALRDGAEHIHRVDPPVGYEKHLLQALNSQLNLKSQVEVITKTTQERRSFKWWQLRPALSWSLVGSLSVALLSVGLLYFQNKNQQRLDLMQVTAVESDVDNVNRWIASVGDPVTRLRYGMHDLQSFSWLYSEQEFKKVSVKEN